MKKLIVAILIMSFLTPVVAMADNLSIVGCWAHYELLNTGTPYIYVLYFAEDHHCYFLGQAYKTDEPWLGRTHAGTWDVLQDGTIYAETGEGTHMEFTFSDDYYVAYEHILGDYYINLDIIQMN